MVRFHDGDWWRGGGGVFKRPRASTPPISPRKDRMKGEVAFNLVVRYISKEPVCALFPGEHGP